jgi:hypothetical protein
MTEYSLSSWQDYWKIFDELIELLKQDKQEDIILELKDAQKYVNGLTDGWFEFKFAFERCLRLNRSKMTSDQTDIADFLIKTLSKSLKNR